MPMTAAIPKQMSWRFVSLNASLVLILDRSFGTLTYATIKNISFLTSGQLGPKFFIARCAGHVLVAGSLFGGHPLLEQLPTVHRSAGIALGHETLS